MSDKTQTRTVAVAGFPYRALVVGPDGTERFVHKFALRGDTIELADPADVERGDNNGHFLKDGEPLPGTPPALSLDEMGLMTDEQLRDLWVGKPPAIADLQAAIGEDKELAQRVLDLESASAKPRVSLVAGLEKLVGEESELADPADVGAES